MFSKGSGTDSKDQSWREVLLERVLFVTIPALVLSITSSLLTSGLGDRVSLLPALASVLLSVAALFRRDWPFGVRGAAMIAPMAVAVVTVYARVGFKGNASAHATVVVILTGLLFGRRRMIVVVIICSAIAIVAGVAMSLNVMPGHPLRIAQIDVPALWIRNDVTAILLWTIAGGAVTYVVERIERSLLAARDALIALQAEQERRRLSEAARQQALQAMVQAQRKEIVSQLAAGVAHDVRNVLSVMSVWSTALLGEPLAAADKERARAALTDAQKQGQALTRQLMTLARPHERRVTRFALDRPIDTTAQTLTAALPRTIALRIDTAAAPEVEADETELQQVVYNLVLNARDAMSDGGSIRVATGAEVAPIPIEVVGGALPAGRWATLTVTDSGPGIDAAIRERIFDPFFTTKGPERGTGLGLATVLRIAKSSGGGVTLASEIGRGTTFKLYFPAAGTDQSSKSIENSPEPVVEHP